jgi:membrane fusion protein
MRSIPVKKLTVRGFLKPNKGVIKSYAQQGGVVENLLVHEGEHVIKNQLLATIVIPQKNNAGIELSTQLITQLNQQKQLIDNEIKQQQILKKTEANNLAQQLLALREEKSR